jgi:acyl dehydratase
MADVPQEGDERTYTRTFTTEEVRAFADLSNDEGYHHLVADEDGTVVVHGLLTATLPTKLGGEMDFLARTMEFEFPRPAYTGVAITCEATTESVEEREERYDVVFSFVCTDADERVVLRGESSGVIFASG